MCVAGGSAKYGDAGRNASIDVEAYAKGVLCRKGGFCIYVEKE